MQINELKSSLMTVQNKRDQFTLALRANEIQIGKTNRALTTITRDLEKQTHHLEALTKEKSVEELSLKHQRQILSQQIMTSFAIGKQGYIKIMLNQQDPAQVGRSMIYFDYFNRARAEQITIIDAKIDEIEKLTANINIETERLNQLKSEQFREINELKRQNKGRQQIIAGLNKDILNKHQKIALLEADEKRLLLVIDKIQQALADIKGDDPSVLPFSQQKGRLIWPSSGKISAKFGRKRHIGRLKWNGVLIGGNEGKPVSAVYHGRIAFSDWLRGFGLLTIIDHGHGFMSLYGHNQSLHKSVGDWVRTGETIATVGRSGGNHLPGLYFEIRQNGTPKNPAKWCNTLAKK